MAKTTAIPGGEPHHPIAMKELNGAFFCPICGAEAKSGFFGELEQNAVCAGNETILGATGH
jgi:hypothetical protein